MGEVFFLLTSPLMGDSKHNPNLFKILKKWRSRKAEEEGVPVHQVLRQEVLVQIIARLPDNAGEK